MQIRASIPAALRPAPALCLAIVIAAATLAPHRAAAQTSSPPDLAPDGAFVQFGDGSHTASVAAGAVWRLQPAWRLAGGIVKAHVEASLGYWVPHGGEEPSRRVTQVGITPVLRWRRDGPWFGEVGIGANIIAPLFRNGDRRFSTAFNFGDHLAFGRTFGERGEYELALRLEHYSNGGIRKPNPGVNFVQLRLGRWF